MFHPSRLSREIITQIAEESRFLEDKHFYFNLKNYLELHSELSPVIKSKLASRIELYKPEKNFVLEPIGKLNESVNYVPVSILEVKNLFADEGVNFFAKRISEENKTAIYLLSTEAPIIKNFKVTIIPGNLTVYGKDNSDPLIIDSSQEIEKILLELDKEITSD